MKTAANDFWQKYKTVFLATFLSGIFSHGFMMFNKISWHDDVTQLFGVGATFSSGRWGLGILAKVFSIFFGFVYSVPVFNAMLSLLFISLAAVLVCKGFNISNKVGQGLVAALMVTLPVVTSTFAYMFTAPYYFFALLLSFVGGYLVTRFVELQLDCGSAQNENKKPLNGMKFLYILGGIFAITFSLGVYQAYFVNTICFIFFYLFFKLSEKNVTIKKWIISCVISIFVAAISLVLYFVLNKMFLFVKGIEMVSYQGLNTMGSMSLKTIIEGIAKCYSTFFLLFTKGYEGLFRTVSSRILLLLVVASSLALLFYVIKKENSIFKKIILIVLIALAPIVIQLIELMTNNESGKALIHTLMVYALIFLFIVPLAAQQRLAEENKGFVKIISKTLSIFLALMVLSFSFINNAAYLKMWNQINQTQQYYNRMIVRIESTTDYTSQMPVVFIGKFKNNSFIRNDKLQQQIRIIPYSDITYIDTQENSPSYVMAFLQNHNNFSKNISFISGKEAYEKHEELKNLDCYPSANSIRVIDDIVYVKISE